MKRTSKRLLCFLLAFVMLVAFLPQFPLRVSAVEDSGQTEVTWEQGTIAYATGLDRDDTTRLRTVGYLCLSAYGAVSIDRGYTVTNFVYDQNYNYLGSSNWLGSGVGFEVENLQEKYPEGIYFRVALRTDDSQTILPESVDAAGVTFHGAGEDLPVRDDVVKFTDAGNIGTWQDGAIYDGKLFAFGASGTGAVYDLKTAGKLGDVTLDGKDVLKPHANSVCFGSTFYTEEDQYPLLYINIYNNYSSAEDRLEGTCCVYRVREEDGSFFTELIQVIRIGFVEDLTLWKSKENNGDIRPYGNFLVDTDNNNLYAYVMRDANRTTRFFRFDLPAVEEGVYSENYGCNVVTLESQQIECYFDTEYFNIIQGGCYLDGNILSAEGSSNGKLRVIDLEAQELKVSYSLAEVGLTKEPEVICADPETGIIYYAAADGVLRKLDIPGSFRSEYRGKVISVMGDSISTFAGYIPEADGFNLAHRTRYPDTSRIPDVISAEQTWWMQVINELDAKLGVNESWAGSCIYWGDNMTTQNADTGEQAAMASLTRIRNLGSNGTPDVIFLYGGGNDRAKGVTVGSFDPANVPSEVDLTATQWDTFSDSCVAAIMRMQHYYPDAEIVVLMSNSSSENDYIRVIREICGHFDVPFLFLNECGLTASMHPDGSHPNDEGMDIITGATLDVLLDRCNMEPGENVVYSLTHDLTNASASLHYYKGVSAGRSFTETITGEDLTVTVTMGGVDITENCYADGVITIDSVTGDLVITAEGTYNVDGHLQQLPENVCAGTNLWTALEPENIYYTVNGWGNTSAGTTWSITFPVAAGDRICATSFGAYPDNGSSANGVRVTWFDENGVLQTVSRDQVYAEFAANGYLTAPEGAVALNVPMTNNQVGYKVYILTAEHSYTSVTTAPTCTSQGYTTHTCTICGDSYVDDYVDARGYDWMLEDNEFKILLIGNSYSQDASNCGQGMKTSQLLDILQSMLGDEVKVTVGLLYSGGKGINWHATQAEQGNKIYGFHTISTDDPTWKSQGTSTSATGLEWTDWDVISLQHYGLNVTTGEESVPYPDTTDEKFYPLETASEYMLDYINQYAPQADVFFYMHWAQTKSMQLNAALSRYEQMADYIPVVLDYVGEGSGKCFADIIPVGLSIQNARTTYLALLSYNTSAYGDGNLNLTTDAQIGLQRDGGHVSFNIGRYIAALTFAETIIPEEMRAEGYVLPDIRITESVGKLPKEYTTIAQLAVAAAVSGWKENASLAVTTIEGYETDPTVAAGETLAAATLNVACSATADEISRAALAILPADFAVDAVTLPEDLALVPGDSFTCEVTIRFGYTSKTVTVSCQAVTLVGDVNGDGKVNTLDRVILSRYLAKWEGYNDSSLNLTAADVNQDGKVNTLDRVILSRYLAKWSGYETLPLAK